ncbi:hypothetical protein R1flu_007481 [Riccia fluitans]|uniref:Uncharacterized protein n=1 Tax=Riccia fluitans TaxID=41844 RepID=A0ABD1YYZ8_9MARC
MEMARTFDQNGETDGSQTERRGSATRRSGNSQETPYFSYRTSLARSDELNQTDRQTSKGDEAEAKKPVSTTTKRNGQTRKEKNNASRQNVAMMNSGMSCKEAR